MLDEGVLQSIQPHRRPTTNDVDERWRKEGPDEKRNVVR
jgi:hypothetical protein